MSEPYQLLEREFAEWNGLDPAGMVVTNSGTAALHLSLECVQPEANGVVLPDYTMVACARAVTLANMDPTFIDCGDDLLADWSLMADPPGPKFVPAHVRRRNQGVLMMVHTYGRRNAFPRWEVGGPFQDGPLKYVEDLAEAHGVKPYPETDAACWSFFKNKIVAGEEGGAVWFRDPTHATLARSLRTLGFTDAHDYTHVPRGHNYRLANCLAERIRASLRMADTNIKVRRVIEGWYDQRCPEAWRMPKRDAVWVFDVRIPGMTSDVQTRVVRALRSAGIEARHGFKPCSTLEEYKGGPVGPNALRLSREVIYLPVVPFVTSEADVSRAFDVIEGVVAPARTLRS